MNCGNGAKRDNFVARVGDFGAGVAREKFLAWSDKATVGVPEIVYDWWYDAVMHVARDEIIEFIKLGGNLRIGQENWRMNDGDFGFMFG